jgi:biopolymer transport protein ExbB
MTFPALTFDTAYFHHVCIYVLYAAGVLLTFVLIERLVYYVLLNMRANQLVKVVSGTAAKPEAILQRRDLLSRGLAVYIAAVKNPTMSRNGLEDLSAATFISVSSRIGARLWILDTIVTAAPLLGLFGTILGIMDTFHALSGGGISDPAAVSRGIADALLATAIGIGVALYGLVGHNILHRYADHLTEEFKGLILSSHALANQEEAIPARRHEPSAIGQQFGHAAPGLIPHSPEAAF